MPRRDRDDDERPRREQHLDAAFERGLPSNLDAERLVLGAILYDDAYFTEAASLLEAEDFALEKHRRIFARMCEIAARSNRIDRVTLAEELMKQQQLEACDGLSYIVSLDDGLPTVFTSIGGWCRLIKDKSRLRRAIFSSQKIIDAALTGQWEADQLVAYASERFMDLAPASAGGLESAGDILRAYPGGMEAFLDPTKRARGLETGFRALDERTGGFRPGELIVIAARPSMGKTALALNIAEHVSRKGRPVALFSLEMAKQQLMDRSVCARAEVDALRFRHGYLNREERDRLATATGELAELPLYIDDTAGAGLMEVYTKLLRLRAAHGVDLAIIDYLQLMTVKHERIENRTQEIGAITRGLKAMAKELPVPVVVLSQLTRDPERRAGDHRPLLSDLRESGNIEQDADLVMFVFREEVYKPDREDLKGMAELIIAKQRNGPIGTVKLVFLNMYARFVSMVGDLGDAAPPA